MRISLERRKVRFPSRAGDRSGQPSSLWQVTRVAMVILRLFSALLLITVACALAGCGGSTFDVQNPPAPPQNNVSIAFQSTPPQSIPINGQASLSAVVSNDQSNAGVNWSLSCSNTGNCGTLSASHTSSGAAVTYTPPLSLIGNSQLVTIVAYATANQTANVSATISIAAFGSVLNGTYIFHVEGADSNLQPYQIAGMLALDGSTDSCAGFINSGQQTLNTVAAGSVTSVITGSSGSPCVPGPSYYFVNADGRGIIVLSLPDPANPAPGVLITETFSIVVLTSSKALISEVNSTSSAGTFSGTGTLELQDPSAAGVLPSGAYALVLAGSDPSPLPVGFGGVLNIAQSGAISGNNSLADMTNQDTFGGYDTLSCLPPYGPTGALAWSNSSSPSSVVTVSVSTNQVGSACFTSAIILTGYIVDSSHIRLIETDGTYFTSGLAMIQTGFPFTNESFAAPYVFSVIGSTNVIGTVPSSFTVAGVICPDGNGGLDTCTDSSGNPSGGYTDSVFLYSNATLPGGVNSLCSSAPCPSQLSAEIEATMTYQLDKFGIGRVSIPNIKLSPQLNPPEPLVPNMIFYLTGNALSPLVLFTGGNGKNYPALGVGIAYPQQEPATSLSFVNGQIYGLSFSQQPGTGEVDGTGQVTVTLNANSSGGTMTGLIDTDGPTYGNTASGSFACPQGQTVCPDPFGRFSNSTFDGMGEAFYMIDNNDSLFVETDLLSNFDSGGTPQVGLGYVSQRCDVTSATSCQTMATQSSMRRNRAKNRVNKSTEH